MLNWALIFWGRVPSQTQGLVRLLLSAIFAVEVVATIVALGLPFTQPGGGGGSVLVTVFTLATALCQISTIIWLLRHRKE
ncbi:hypothetical protein [Nitrospirillum amazonense]|uniref:Uncharacterized protein n=1 Tax=Nitrospirillum amazonense TaxID=28077 RepID=A0A560J9I5_9PROT|nr:hypothetical protein [Nitrospirillum amazonense]MDG3439578.1 hypothetical protein [Nitrospirillum amazonense]TWB65974.1 hypothetical protein FBZ87_11769 [Nitrospirillum amazonense]